MPVLFVGHGSPMNAIEDDVWMGRRAPSRRSRPHARPRPPSSSSRGHFRHLSGSTTDAEPCPVAIVDAHYQGGGAVVACVVARRWTDALPSDERVVTVAAVLPYRPGAFFERELPCILRVLSLVRGKFNAVVVDGYVDLDERGTPGLGAHLHAQLAGAVPVVGVAKTAYQSSGFAVRVLRGSSQRPLFVTTRGISPADAARLVERMHGEHRIPTLLARVDHLARGRV